MRMRRRKSSVYLTGQADGGLILNQMSNGTTFLEARGAKCFMTDSQTASRKKTGRGRDRWPIIIAFTALFAAPLTWPQTLTTLYNFQGSPSDGEEPCAITGDPVGNLYGTTYFGGASNFGAVFKIDSSGNETILHGFTGGKDGQSPCAPLTRAANGDLYGTAIYGGLGNGAVFVMHNGHLTTSYDFIGGPSGAFPSGPVEIFNGSLYG